MSKSNVKRIWTKEELIAAYYIAKWGFNGLNIDADELVTCVIKDTTANSLEMQVSNFRFLLDIPGRQLSHASAEMYEIKSSLKDKTSTQVRRMVLDYIDSKYENRGEYSIKKGNKEVEKNRVAANIALDAIFELKLKNLRKYRNLVPVNN